MADGALEVEFWRNYRRRTGELTWRAATPDDMPAIERLRVVSERLLHRKQAAPNLFETPVLLALVAEDKSGAIVDLVYAEAQVEIVKVACSRQGFKEAWVLEQDLRHWLKARGFRKAIIRTTHRLKHAMSDALQWAGFRSHDKILSYWTREL